MEKSECGRRKKGEGEKEGERRIECDLRSLRVIGKSEAIGALPTPRWEDGLRIGKAKSKGHGALRK
jgi:hypothetical protein